MTNGLNKDATLTCDTKEHKTTEDLVQDLLIRSAAQETDLQSETVSEQADIQTAKPARSMVNRMLVTPVRKIAAAIANTKTAVRSYQPAPRHVAFLLMVTILLIVPWLVPSLLAIVLGTISLTYLIAGHDVSVKMITIWFNWLKRRDSHGAEVIRARAERTSTRLTRWLERLPANWTTGLYLPDFTQAEDFSEKLTSDPFHRLMGEAQKQ